MNFFRYKVHQLAYGDARKKITKNIFVSILAIMSSILVSLLIAMIIYRNPSLFYKIIEQIFISPFSQYNLNITISTIAIFGVGALSFLIAFRSGLFNIGISGQMLFGAIAAVVFAQHMGNMPNGLGQILMLLISIIFAGLVAGIIGVLKAFLNMNEVVSSIMFNWIVYFVGTWILTRFVASGDGGMNTNPLGANLILNITSQNTILSGSWVPLLIIMVGCTFITIVFLGYTTFGKKVINTGLSTTGSHYAGYNVKFNQILAMVLSGAFAGILGIMVYCGRANGMPCNILSRSIPQDGFNGMSVGLIAMANPWAVVPISFFFGMIDGSKADIQGILSVDHSISDLMFGVVVYGAAIISFFYYVVPFRWYLRIFKGKIYEEHYSEYETSMLRELNEVDDEVYLLKKKYRSIISHIHNHKPKHFDKHRVSINNVQARKEYHRKLEQIYERHVAFKNMERQIFLMNVIGFKKDNLKNNYDLWLHNTQVMEAREYNYSRENFLLAKSESMQKTTVDKKALTQYRISKQHLLNHYKNKKYAGKMHYEKRYNHINKAYVSHRDLARKYRKQLNVFKVGKEE